MGTLRTGKIVEILQHLKDANTMQRKLLPVKHFENVLFHSLSPYDYQLHLNKSKPRIVCPDGKVIDLRRRGNVFVLDTWFRRPGNHPPSFSAEQHVGGPIGHRQSPPILKYYSNTMESKGILE